MSDESQAPDGSAAHSQANELLALEAEVLRTRVKEAAARAEKLRRERDEYRRRVEEIESERPAPSEAPRPGFGYPVPPGKVLLEQERYDDLRQAKRDLVRLLRRLGRPPMGWALRRQEGYRRLRQRWLREG